MELEARYDIFEPGDLTSLVCVEDPDLQKIVFEQLGALNYKIHTGMFGDDVSLKLKTHRYDVVIVYETFGGIELEYNQVLNESAHLPISQRRKQVFVLLGPNMVTSDEMQAFAYGVDLVVSLSDVQNMRMMLRRTVLRHEEFYSRLHECLAKEGMA